MDAKSIQQLKMFVQACKMNPELLHEPSLSFFKTYIESLGATIPAKEEAPEEAPKAEEKPVPEPKAPEPAPMEVESEEEEEVVELDNSGVIDEDKLIDLPMGEEDKECSEADMDQANELRGQGQMAMMDGNLDEARDIYGKAILANPHSAPLFAKRAQLLLRQKKPRNVIRDCDKALVINPDNALAHRCKGKALRLLGKWEEAASSLGAAQKIDYDDDTHEMMNTIVKPNADKLRAARLRREGKRREKDHKERAERVKSAREERQKAYDEQKKQRETRKMVHQIATHDEFKTKVSSAKDNKLIVVDFWATWCGPCIRIAPTLEKIASEESAITVYKVDVDENSETMEAEGIECMPTFKFYKDGVCVETVMGANEAKLREMIAKHK